MPLSLAVRALTPGASPRGDPIRRLRTRDPAGPATRRRALGIAGPELSRDPHRSDTWRHANTVHGRIHRTRFGGTLHGPDPLAAGGAPPRRTSLDASSRLPARSVARSGLSRRRCARPRTHPAQDARGRSRTPVSRCSPGGEEHHRCCARHRATGAGSSRPRCDDARREARGTLLGISDAVYTAHRTIVEIEGDHHRVSRAQWERDIAKYAAYAANGWEVVRLLSRHVRGEDPAGARVVASVLQRRAPR